MKLTVGPRGLGALTLLALAAVACGDDTSGTGGGGGAGTTSSASTGAGPTTTATTTTTTAGVTTSSSSGGGDGGAGDGGSTTSAQGGSTSDGGGGSGQGGSEPACTEITIDAGTVRAVGGFRIGAAFTPELGDDATADAIGIGYANDEGDFELDSVVNDNFATCEQCILVLEDTDGSLDGSGRLYFQSGGTMSVTEGSAFPFATVDLAGVTLVEVTIDEDGISTPVAGGACLTVVDTSVEFDIPDEWTCNPIFYGTLDGCDCNCGAPDPDCNVPDDDRLFGCGASGPPSDDQPTCSDAGECVAPVNWTCDDTTFFDGETCNCECGTVDPDCGGVDNLPVDGCDVGAVCRAGSCVTIPDAWDCEDAFYSDGATCDCACGVYDPDCDLGGPVFGCEAGEGCTAEGLCGVPATWTCDELAYNDGVTCDCACGTRDPDCQIVDAPITGCDVDEICTAAGECGLPPANDTCDTAIVLTEGTVTGSWINSSDSLDPGDTGCTDFAEVGGDVFYSVHLDNGQTLTVEINQVGSLADSALYLVTDCADADSCVAGIDTPPNNAEVLTYTATADVDLFLVVDQFQNTDQVDFELTVDIQ